MLAVQRSWRKKIGLVVAGLVFIVMTVGVSAAVLLSRESQDLRQSACVWECNSCGCGCADYFDNGRQYCRQPAQPAAPPPEASCASGWSCNGNCADQTAVTIFTNTWCSPKERWLWEAAGNSASCGGTESTLKSSGCGGTTPVAAVGTVCSSSSPTASACYGQAFGSACLGGFPGSCQKNGTGPNGEALCGCVAVGTCQERGGTCFAGGSCNGLNPPRSPVSASSGCSTGQVCCGAVDTALQAIQPGATQPTAPGVGGTASCTSELGAISHNETKLGSCGISTKPGTCGTGQRVRFSCNNGQVSSSCVSEGCTSSTDTSTTTPNLRCRTSSTQQCSTGWVSDTACPGTEFEQRCDGSISVVTATASSCASPSVCRVGSCFSGESVKTNNTCSQGSGWVCCALTTPATRCSSPGSSCNPGTKTTGYCSTSLQCQPVKGVGASCSQNYECSTNQACRTSDSGTLKTCQPVFQGTQVNDTATTTVVQIPVGGRCTSTSQCQAGLSCRYSTEAKALVCTQPVSGSVEGEGARCSTTADCPGGLGGSLRCRSGVCVNLSTVAQNPNTTPPQVQGGQICAVATNAQCLCVTQNRFPFQINGGELCPVVAPSPSPLAIVSQAPSLGSSGPSPSPSVSSSAIASLTDTSNTRLCASASQCNFNEECRYNESLRRPVCTLITNSLGGQVGSSCQTSYDCFGGINGNLRCRNSVCRAFSAAEVNERGEILDKTQIADRDTAIRSFDQSNEIVKVQAGQACWVSSSSSCLCISGSDTGKVISGGQTCRAAQESAIGTLTAEEVIFDTYVSVYGYDGAMAYFRGVTDGTTSDPIFGTYVSQCRTGTDGDCVRGSVLLGGGAVLTAVPVAAAITGGPGFVAFGQGGGAAIQSVNQAINKAVPGVIYQGQLLFIRTSTRIGLTAVGGTAIQVLQGASNTAGRVLQYQVPGLNLTLGQTLNIGAQIATADATQAGTELGLPLSLQMEALGFLDELGSMFNPLSALGQGTDEAGAALLVSGDFVKATDDALRILYDGDLIQSEGEVVTPQTVLQPVDAGADILLCSLYGAGC